MVKLYLPSTWSDGSSIDDNEGDQMELTSKHAEQIEETHDTVLNLKAVLLGVNGSPGLVKKVEDFCEQMTKLKEKQDNLDKRFWILIAFMIGSGILGGVSIWELLK